MSTAPTVSAFAALPGDAPQASKALFPAATTTAMLESSACWIILSNNALYPPRVKLMLTTDGLRKLLFLTKSMTHCSPHSIESSLLDPLSVRTLTACSVTLAYTPTVAPPTAPAHHVPCPFMSFQAGVPHPADIAHIDIDRRLANSGCGLIPVSRMNTCEPSTGGAAGSANGAEKEPSTVPSMASSPFCGATCAILTATFSSKPTRSV
jgi:hypothetical protein